MNDVVESVGELHARAFDAITSARLTDIHKWRLVMYAYGDLPIAAGDVRQHLLDLLPSKVSPAEVCMALRMIRADAPKPEVTEPAA